MFKPQKFETELAGRKFSVEVGKLASQTNAACLIRHGDTVVLATVIMDKNVREGIDFFPLQVEVREKMYAAGKIKGSKFVKGEGRPTDRAVLAGRMIDRGIRPLFNQEIRNEVQVVLTALSYDDQNSFVTAAINAASIALHISDIPWNGPLAGVAVGRVDGNLKFCPTLEELEKSDFNFVFSSSGEKILMIDADADEVPENELKEAFAFGLKESKELIKFINSVREEIGLEKKDEKKLVEAAQVQGEISLDEKKKVFEEARKFFAPQLDKYLFNQPKGTKRERKEVAKELLEMFIVQLEGQQVNEEIISYVKDNFESYLEAEVTRAILERDQRIDGRQLDEIRPLSSEISILPRTHGSGLFSRGETQVLSVVTLGAPGDVQILDEMTEDDTKKSYMHFYNCPPYSFGETGAFRGPGRREIGHGALAEKAILPVLPDKTEFPYTILVVSEVMGSNGSSSMASTCGSTLALMDAGVPIKKPVAGIAMGLASDGKNYKILTDLQDFEDGEGGMDFKVTGTADGVTAIQMDTKTDGLSLEICEKTLDQALKARKQILENIHKTIPEVKGDLSPYAPRIVTLEINPEKIGEVIGPGGKMINQIIDECGVSIDIEDSGLVFITSDNGEGAKKAVEWIKGITKDPEVGEIYTGKVVRLMDFGAFVEILPGKDGMVHISEFSNERVEKITDVAKIGQEIKVKVIEIDNQGRVNLSVKQAMPGYDPKTDPRNNRNRSNGSRYNGGNRHNDNHDRPKKKFGFRK